MIPAKELAHYRKLFPRAFITRVVPDPSPHEVRLVITPYSKEAAEGWPALFHGATINLAHEDDGKAVQATVDHERVVAAAKQLIQRGFTVAEIYRPVPVKGKR